MTLTLYNSLTRSLEEFAPDPRRRGARLHLRADGL